ncbi:glycosyltransferase [Pedobacter lusitanus]|uniref:glycosyltransferase n=1 Tax=Pedobacter lusitanus TaxID=1503925 RepID=UPI0006967191|nr:glycosyltransferase [Pedobacter lusitanus]
MFKVIKKIVRGLSNKPAKDYEVMPVTGGNVFDWKHISDRRLYTDNNYALEVLEENINFRLEPLTDHIQTHKEQITYHCYWHGNIGRKQAFSIKSFLCTQDLTRCRVILWLDADNGYHNHEKNPILKEILHLIEVKIYDPYQEIKNTPWKNKKELVNEPENLAKRSDAFRFLILYKYGGVYFDLDVMFLKDFSSLLESEFCYAWETQPYANSAILSLKSKSEIATYILNKSSKKRTVLPWIILNYSDSLLNKLNILPCTFF